MSRQCSATTKAGSRCQAWSLRDADPPLCSAHAGRNVGAGAPAGNQNARKHGFYSDAITVEELRRIVKYAEERPSLRQEIDVFRVYLRRLFLYLTEGDEPTRQDLVTVGKLIVSTGRTIARMARDERALSGDSSDGLNAAIAQALDELGTEWGLPL